MRKKQAFILVLIVSYTVYLVFLFFMPSGYININKEINITKSIGSFLNHIPYLKLISLHLINIYTLLAVFFFIAGYMYNKKNIGFFISFIIVSISLYFIVIKANKFFGFYHHGEIFFSIYLTIFTFLLFSHKDKISVIPLIFVLFSFLSSFFTQMIPISGILLSFLFGLILGKILLKTEKYFF